MAYAFARKGSLWWLLVFAFLLGFGTTIAEPALMAVADEAAELAAQAGAIASDEESQEDHAEIDRRLRERAIQSDQPAVADGVDVGQD